MLALSAAVSAALLATGCQTAPPAKAEAARAAGEGFRDCRDCPEMVVLPAGRFLMGSPAEEPFRGPEARHPVAISRPFAVSRREVTFAEWDRCVEAGACVGPADDEGWGRGDMPAIHISWSDAKAYAAWLSRRTGQPYRLPSEAEWEYAARAGGDTTFSHGPTLGAGQANFDASTATRLNPAGENRGRTLPAGSFPPNAFGLHDMHGNVWEWCGDAYDKTFY